MYEERRDAVYAAQYRLGMTPRNDSVLTERYAMGQTLDFGHVTADEIARELMATDFIYKNTLYGEVIQDFMRDAAETLRDMYGLSWSAAWKIIRAYAPNALKLMMLSASGVRIPGRVCDADDGVPNRPYQSRNVAGGNDALLNHGDDGVVLCAR